MELKDHIKIRKIGTEYIVVDANGTNVDFTKVIKLNASAAYLLGEVQGKSFEEEELVDLLLQKYTIDSDTAKIDVHELISKLTYAGIVVS